MANNLNVGPGRKPWTDNVLLLQNYPHLNRIGKHRMSFRNNKHGIILVAVVMLIVFASVVISGVTFFIIQRFSQTGMKLSGMRALYLAQAGIHNALYNFRFRALTGTGSFSLGRTDIDAQNYFIVGGTDADFVMVDASLAAIGEAKNQTILNLTVRNANNTREVTIDRVIIQWDFSARRMREVRINGSKQWNGNLASPADCDIKDFPLDSASTIYLINGIEFDKDIGTIGYVDIEFVMLDGSSRSLRVYPASNDLNFVVRATGKTVNSNLYRSIKAEYDVLTAKITDYREISDEMLALP